VLQCLRADLFKQPGCARIEREVPPYDEHTAIRRHLHVFNAFGEDLAISDLVTSEATVDSPIVRRLLSITSIDVTVAVGLAAIGDMWRFSGPQKLIGYFGLSL
jgi:hypothetical protein